MPHARSAGAMTCALVLLFSLTGPGRSRQDDTHAGDGKEEPVYELDPGITPPKVVHQVSPEHPAEGFRIAGTVLIGLVVGSGGEPRDVHVLKSLDKGVDANAVDAVKQWRFEPAKKAGEPVAVRLSIEIRFHDM
jgi:periplasmic protein TonB